MRTRKYARQLRALFLLIEELAEMRCRRVFTHAIVNKFPSSR